MTATLFRMKCLFVAEVRIFLKALYTHFIYRLTLFQPHKMCNNVSVNNFLSTNDNYLKLSTITHNDILFQTVPSF